MPGEMNATYTDEIAICVVRVWLQFTLQTRSLKFIVLSVGGEMDGIHRYMHVILIFLKLFLSSTKKCKRKFLEWRFCVKIVLIQIIQIIQVKIKILTYHFVPSKPKKFSIQRGYLSPETAWTAVIYIKGVRDFTSA
jgi:hypothetical protein